MRHVTVVGCETWTPGLAWPCVAGDEIRQIERSCRSVGQNSIFHIVRSSKKLKADNSMRLPSN